MAAACAAAAGLFGGVAEAQFWTYKGVVAAGEQGDAVRGPNDRVHLVTTRYYQFDANGNKLVDEAMDAADQHQGGLDFNPAIAVETNGNAHLITRRNGNWTDGYEIWYSKRTAAGAWSSYKAVDPVIRNYQVAVAAADNGNVYLTHGKSDGNVWGPVKFYRETGGAMTFLGDLTGILRIDCDQVIRTRGNELYLGSGKCDGGSVLYFGRTAATANPVSALGGSLKTHADGGNRKGAPSIAIDAQANFHVAYGATSTVYYNRYNASNAKVFSSDKLVFSNLGWWSIHAGLNALATSDDGQLVAIVALKPDETNKEASNSELLFSISTNAGAAWTPPLSVGKFTTGGEGRCRPALVFCAGKFMLFYKDKAASGTSLAILPVLTPAAAPAFATAAGTYTGSVSVAITSATAGAEIRYTRDGSIPLTTSLLYAAPIVLTNSATVTAVSVKSGMWPGGPAAAAYRVLTPYQAWAEGRIADPALRTETADPDGDGANNLGEFVADTHPTNRTSRFAVQAVDGGGAVRVSFLSSSSRVYSLQYTTHLGTGTWSDIGGQSGLRGSGAVTSLVDAVPASPRIYRVRVALPP
jgi:hypothetical protein